MAHVASDQRGTSWARRAENRVNRHDDSDEARGGRPEPSFSQSCLKELKHSANSGSRVTQSRELNNHEHAARCVIAKSGGIEREQEGPTARRTR